MSNEKVPQGPGAGTPLMDSAYPPAAMGGNFPPPPAYTTGPQNYPPGGPQPAVIIAPPVHATVIVGQQLTDTPAVITCASCHQNITTRVAYSAGLLAWLIFGIICLFGCWLGCCLIPFCVDSCKDVDHFCPNCNHHIYKFKRM